MYGHRIPQSSELWEVVALRLNGRYIAMWGIPTFFWWHAEQIWMKGGSICSDGGLMKNRLSDKDRAKDQH
ncbi:hypothetical protein RB213_002453 [Colletotrichum asianum]